MDNDLWREHISHWKIFLEEMLKTMKTDENPGESEKVLRQFSAIERLRYAAVSNPRLLQEFIAPSAITREEKVESFVLDLNETQKTAVRKAVGDSVLSLIQGPPGTGKTQVIAEICLQLFRNNPHIRILVCSETHVAVNNLISRISESDKSLRIVRIRDKEQDTEVDRFSPGAIAELYSKWINEYCDDVEIKNAILDSLENPTDKSFEKALAMSSNITGMTCNRVGAYDFLDMSETFDVVIVDEVCKATLPEIVMALEVAKKAILVGDPRQLPPVFCTEEIEVIKSIEKCNLQRYMYIDTLFEISKGVTVLDTQYRMANPIGTMISELFYKGQLKNGRNDNDISYNAIEWIDYEPSRMWPEPINGEKGYPQIMNSDECEIIKSVLIELDKSSEKKMTVGVISPYRNQVQELRKCVGEYEKIEVMIDTVDGFQGKECNVIIFSITRTNGTFRFLGDDRRLNVALSRARDKIVIVGNLKYAQQHGLLKKICSYCKVRKM